MSSDEDRESGYFDGLYSVFEAHQHPIILVEQCAMRWMGLRVTPEQVSNSGRGIPHRK
jgi:hypothetical protein